MTDEGWLDLMALLVPSDRSRVPGDETRNDTRDRGSKLVFFDPATGDNATAPIWRDRFIAVKMVEYRWVK